jgi:hypothetical protein
LGDIMPKVEGFSRLSEPELAELVSAVELYLVTGSNNFTIQCRAHLNNRAYAMNAICVLDKNGKILYWQEP